MAKNKRKVLTQRQVGSRINFLYQAATTMAQVNPTLAAYYNRLSRNVGTKALMHISPGMKRTFCKRCSLPLLPGINSTLFVEQQQQQKIQHNTNKNIPLSVEENQQQQQQQQQEELNLEHELQSSIKNKTALPIILEQEHQQQQQLVEAQTVANKKKRRNRRQRRKRQSQPPTSNHPTIEAKSSTTTAQDNIDYHVTMQLQCSLCDSKRCFRVNDLSKDCWLECPEAVVQTISLKCIHTDKASSRRLSITQNY